MFYIVGLGNPGGEYENSRHNAGRMAVLKLGKDLGLEEFKFNPASAKATAGKQKINALVSMGKIGKEKLTLILPETFMNKSGNAISCFVKPKLKTSKKGLENLIIIHDDIDLALGSIKISYNKGTGGHRGLDSVVKAVKTKEFVRVRIGISPTTPSGKIKKPQGEQKVLDFILKSFKPAEMAVLKKVFKRSNEAIEAIVTSSRDKAMNTFN